MQKENIINNLSKISHPLQGKTLKDLNMIGDIEIDENSLNVYILFEEATDKSIGEIKRICTDSLKKEFGKDKDIFVIAKLRKNNNTKKTTKKPPENAKIDKLMLKNVKNIIAISSGKGGVGKSTVTVNLALTLSKQGYKVGILDADIFGPSIPKMFDDQDKQPSGRKINDKQYIIPLEKYGIKYISIGFFVEPEKAILWRGPLASSTLKQLLFDTIWGDLDYLLIDTPPGTSDIHLTLVQDLDLTGAIIVSTPQKLALIDARKGISMYQNKDINVPVLGLVENMSWFTPAELPDNKYYLFGKDGGVELSKDIGINLLGQIPLVQSVREAGDSGETYKALEHKQIEQAYLEIVNNLIK